MTKAINETVICQRCGHQWTIDLARIGKPEKVLYRNNGMLLMETFRLVCPSCGNVQMLEVSFEERTNA